MKPIVVTHGEICKVLRVMNVVPGPEGRARGFRVNSLIEDQIKLGRVKRLRRGEYALIERRKPRKEMKQ
jgi:hypothetical protein